MTENVQEQAAVEQKPNDKEYNFAQIRNQLAQERQARQQLEAEVQRLSQVKQSVNDDDDDGEPYVDKRKLGKELNRFAEKNKQETQQDIKQAVNQALAQERQQNWLKQNSDFQEVMSHAEKFANADPELAETILAMPDGFERQKLVYKSIKTMGLHKPAAPQESIQSKIDANRRSPYYQPTGVGSAPYQSAGDFSQSGQKNAYDKMKELQSKLRL